MEYLGWILVRLQILHGFINRSYILSVFCLPLGYEGVARLYRNTTTFTVPKRSRRFFNPAKLIPTIINGIKCFGDERDVSDCLLEGATSLFMDEPMPGSTHTVDDVACLSCTGKNV